MNLGQPFSNQTPMTVYVYRLSDPGASCKQLQAFDWRRVDPGWRPDPG